MIFCISRWLHTVSPGSLRKDAWAPAASLGVWSLNSACGLETDPRHKCTVLAPSLVRWPGEDGVSLARFAGSTVRSEMTPRLWSSTCPSKEGS